MISDWGLIFLLIWLFEKSRELHKWTRIVSNRDYGFNVQTK